MNKKRCLLCGNFISIYVINRGYYTAARGYEFYLLSRLSAANEWEKPFLVSARHSTLFGTCSVDSTSFHEKYFTNTRNLIKTLRKWGDWLLWLLWLKENQLGNIVFGQSEIRNSGFSPIKMQFLLRQTGGYKKVLKGYSLYSCRDYR